mgnify:CR=1 FL=1
MNKNDLLTVIIAPYFTEKTANAGNAASTYAFKVIPNAGKRDVSQAVQLLFSKKVKKVNISNVKRKAKAKGFQSGWKKAYVTLQEGQVIDFTQDMVE